MHRRQVAAAATVFALAAVLVPRPAGTVASHGDDARLPDLAVLAPSDFRIVVRDSGRRVLRFTTIIVNIGNGPFQLSGYDDDDGFAAKKDILSVYQQILEPDGTFSRHHTTATMFWAGDGHDHWHVTDLQVSKLQNLEKEEVGSIKKVGFCFVDNYRYGSSKPPYYTQAISICQTKGNGRVPMGLSRNWGDTYPSTFKYQWVDITDLPNGDYRLRVIADPADVPGGLFLESNETNNVGWAKIRIQGTSVTVLRKSNRP